ncbi:MAG: SRPBCC domain-containing protein [Rhodothermales bacterium]|nr:SRPBCC domain-containing protein [Rhodothermales bacterium]
MREIATQVDVDAPPDAVWAVLIDLDRYAEWNPFIPHAAGAVEEGERLTVRIAPPGGRAMTFRPTVTCVRAEREFRWVGRLLAPFVFEGEHVFELARLGAGGTRLTHRERFGGLLVPLLWGGLNTSTRRGFEQMNAALKVRAEARPRGGPSAL